MYVGNVFTDRSLGAPIQKDNSTATTSTHSNSNSKSLKRILDSHVPSGNSVSTEMLRAVAAGRTVGVRSVPVSPILQRTTRLLRDTIGLNS